MFKYEPLFDRHIISADLETIVFVTGSTFLLGSKKNIVAIKLSDLCHRVIEVSGEPISQHGLAVDATFALERLSNRGDGLNIWETEKEATDSIAQNLEDSEDE